MTAKPEAGAASRLVRIPAGPGVLIEGSLEGSTDPRKVAKGVVLFAHGSGSSRFSPRNTFVAAELRRAGMMTLLIDLLSRDEDQDVEARFDIALLTERLTRAALWLKASPDTRSLPVGVFGASTGAAAALQLAAQMPADVSAVVSRGGRPDLAGTSALEQVRAPTLLIVGGRDHVVIELNQDAYRRLSCEKKLTIVPGATHLFEEAGALERVAALAGAWFADHLAPEQPHEAQ